MEPSKRERDQLIVDNLPLARWMASKWHRFTGIPEEEFLSSAQLGLVRAARTFDVSKSSFGHWGGLWIRAEFQKLCEQWRKVRRELLVLDELAHVNDEGSVHGQTHKDLIAADEDTEVLAHHHAEKQIAREALRCLTPRDRQILMRRYEGLGLREVGEEVGLSGERVRQIERACMRKLRLHATLRD